MEVVIGIVVLVVLVVLIWGVTMYNRLVRLRNLVQEAWRQIDVELHRRYDLIPNLVETVKGYAVHERALFEDVTRARAAAATPGASPAQQAQQEDVLSSAIGRLFAVAENYPQLRASENFVQLQNELTNTEDRIAAGRRFYNANVRSLNTKVEVFPSNIIAGMFNFVRAEYFEVNDAAVRSAPSVSFGDAQGNLGQYGSAQPHSSGGTAQPSHGGQPGAFRQGEGGGQPGYFEQGQAAAPQSQGQQGYQPPTYSGSSQGQPGQAPSGQPHGGQQVPHQPPSNVGPMPGAPGSQGQTEQRPSGPSEPGHRQPGEQPGNASGYPGSPPPNQG